MTRLTLFALTAAGLALAACGGEDSAPAGEDSAGGSTGAGDTATADPLEGVTFEIAGVTGDAKSGKRIFRQCQACHTLEPGMNRVGPSLHGVIGREAGAVEGFRYSNANANSHLVWSEEVLFEYLENPREYLPGTTMSFAGLKVAQQRADVVAYIKAAGGDAE